MKVKVIILSLLISYSTSLHPMTGTQKTLSLSPEEWNTLHTVHPSHLKEVIQIPSKRPGVEHYRATLTTGGFLDVKYSQSKSRVDVKCQKIISLQQGVDTSISVPMACFALVKRKYEELQKIKGFQAWVQAAKQIRLRTSNEAFNLEISDTTTVYDIKKDLKVYAGVQVGQRALSPVMRSWWSLGFGEKKADPLSDRMLIKEAMNTHNTDLFDLHATTPTPGK